MLTCLKVISAEENVIPKSSGTADALMHVSVLHRSNFAHLVACVTGKLASVLPFVVCNSLQDNTLYSGQKVCVGSQRGDSPIFWCHV